MNTDMTTTGVFVIQPLGGEIALYIETEFGLFYLDSNNRICESTERILNFAGVDNPQFEISIRSRPLWGNLIIDQEIRDYGFNGFPIDGLPEAFPKSFHGNYDLRINGLHI